MTEQEAQDLYRKFATPLACFIKLGVHGKAVECLAKTLWTAMIFGPEMEGELWTSLQGDNLSGELVMSVMACYLAEMKPLVAGEQLAALRRRYGLG